MCLLDVSLFSVSPFPFLVTQLIVVPDVRWSWDAVLSRKTVERGRQDGLQSPETIFCLVICNMEEPIQVMRGGV